MKRENNLGVFKLLRFLLLAMCILAVYFSASPDLSVQTLLNHTPQDPAAAAVVLLALYAFKSATVFIPLILLEIVTGHLFSPGTALLLNFMGMLITLTVPYWIGRWAGMNAIQKLIDKYPKFGAMLQKQQDNSYFFCFFVRIISCLPGDIVTMYIGATKTPFRKNLISGILGVLPGMVLATLMGENIQNPDSPMFWIFAGLTVLFAGGSMLLYYLYCRSLHRKEKEEK